MMMRIDVLLNGKFWFVLIVVRVMSGMSVIRFRYSDLGSVMCVRM